MASSSVDRRLGLTGDKGMKAPVDCATTGNITLSGEQTIDGVLTSASRVLVKNQTDTTTNGVYDSSSAAWTRAIDFNGNLDIVNSTALLVAGGAQVGQAWKVVATNPITFGTSAITFSQLAGLSSGAAAGANSDITSLAAITSLNTGPIAGFRNRIINGGMAVDQRNETAALTIVAAAAKAYTVDRWYAYCTGANVTGQQVAGSGSSQFRYKFTGAASVTAIGFGTRLEAATVYDMNGSTSTISVDLANSVLTTVAWALYYANSANTFGTLASPSRTLISSGTFTVSSAVARYSASVSIPSAATTGLELVLSVGAQTSGTWTIGNVQIERGAVATTFERRHYAIEEIMCMRYYERLGGSAVGLGGINVVRSICSYDVEVHTFSNFIYYKALKFARPTLTFYDNSITAGKAEIAAAGGVGANVTVTDANPSNYAGCSVYVQGSTAGMINCYPPSNASCEL